MGGAQAGQVAMHKESPHEEGEGVAQKQTLLGRLRGFSTLF